MTLASGTRLGPYEILSALGAGGMGEVYRARDTRLERTVAIKVLPSRLSSSPEIRERFEREAKAIAQLSHPHICALHDVGREGDVEYLVMEYLEGETVAERLVKGPLPLEQTIRYGVEIAGALDRAHRQGIVHRDLKPGNVMLTKTGAKVLDFGLAKAAAPQSGEQLSSLQTVEKSLTAEGSIVGTLQYMAPEQLEGRDLDPRTDIFALGVVLYEMATGEKAFSGRSQVSLASSILRDQPRPMASIAPMTPPAFDRLVRTCLAKDPDDRWQSAGDIGRELEWIRGGSAEAAAVPAPIRRRKKVWLPWTIATLAIVLGALAWLLPRRTQAPEDLTTFMIAPPSGQALQGTVNLSPDGRRVLLWLQDDGGKTSMATRSFDRLEIRRLPGTDGARGAFWSPDGREIAYFSEGKLMRLSAEGGPAQTICESGSGFSGMWNRDGTILFTKEFGTPIIAVPASGGTPHAVTAIDAAKGEVAHFHPSFLPDGRHFVFTARNLDPAKTQIVLASLDSKSVRPLFHADSSALFADPGYLLFARDNALFAWRFDPRSLELVGQAVPLLDQVRYGTEDNLLAVSVAGGRLTYLPWRMRRRLVWVDRKGREIGTLGDTAGYSDVRIAPDGRRVAVTIRDPAHGQNQDVWVLDTSRGTASRITAGRTDEFDAAWYPDGERLVYVSDRAGFYDLYERPAGGGDEKILLQSKYDKVLPSMSPDGSHMLFSLADGAIFARVLAPLSGGDRGDPVRLSGDSRFSEEHPVLSPDGRWTAFDSVESGQKEIYAQPLAGGPKRQVSVGGGQMPVWSGSELFYAARGGMLMSVALHPDGGRLEIGEPQPLFPMQTGMNGEVQFQRRTYDAAPDGQRFLLIRQAPDAEPDAAVVITNWTALLGRGR